MPTLSGRTLESLQAETDLLAAQKRLNEDERYMLDAMSLQVILTSLCSAYPDHVRYLDKAAEDAKWNAESAGREVDKSKKALERAKTAWENQ